MLHNSLLVEHDHLVEVGYWLRVESPPWKLWGAISGAGEVPSPSTMVVPSAKVGVAPLTAENTPANIKLASAATRVIFTIDISAGALGSPECESSQRRTKGIIL